MFVMIDDLVEKIIRNCRRVKRCNDAINRTEKEEQRKNFTAALGFTEHNIMMTEEYSIASKIIEMLPNKIIIQQHKVLGRFVDL